MNCTEKFIKHSERVDARFAESNAGQSLYIHPTITHLSLLIIPLTEAMEAQNRQ